MKVFVEEVPVNTKDGEVIGKMYIESDSMQFMVNVYSGLLDNLGKEKYKTLGFFSTVEQCLQYIVKQKVMKSDATTLPELLAELREIKEFIKINVTI